MAMASELEPQTGGIRSKDTPQVSSRTAFMSGSATEEFDAGISNHKEAGSSSPDFNIILGKDMPALGTVAPRGQRMWRFVSMQTRKRPPGLELV